MPYFLNLFDLEMLFFGRTSNRSSIQHNTLWEMLPYINRLNLLISTDLYELSASLMFFMLRSWKKAGDQHWL